MEQKFEDLGFSFLMDIACKSFGYSESFADWLTVEDGSVECICEG